MYISLNKIKTYINLTESDPQKISDIITEKSAEIEEMTLQGKALEGVVVGKILEISAHPDADSLRICSVDVGDSENLQIVCGGSNLEMNQDVVVAKLGASVLWHGEGEPVVMKKTKIRGVESLGMICGADEVGLEAEFPKGGEKEIVNISALQAQAGTPISELMNKDDVIYEVENTSITNRADQFSQIGMAREFVACELGTWKTQDPYAHDANLDCFVADASRNDKTDFPIEIIFPENCAEVIPKYLAITVSGVDGKQDSSAEIQEFLGAMGLNSQSALVDISNVVMFETGAPVHIFDAEKVGKKWKFFLTQGGEKIVNLDGEEKTLPANAIALKDESGEIFDMCGIQGGKNSGISESTKNIVIHAPIYDAVKIRRASLAVSQRTDASVMYEKSIPSKVANYGMARTLELVQENFPGSEISSQLFQKISTDESEKTITVTRALVDRVMGIPLSNSEVEKIFSGLGFSYTETQKAWEITVPFFRGDLEIPEDILEEIARMYGLNRIPALAPDITIEKKSPLPSREVERQISDVFLKNGFYEILTLAFLGENLLERMGLKKNEDTMCFVKNPLSEDIEIMRASLSPRLFETAERNIRFQEKFRLFESGNVFRMDGERKIEEYRITSLMVGDDFFAAKAVAEEIIADFGMKYRISQKKYDLPFAHPARGAEMIAGKDASVKLFQIHPKIAKEFGLPENSSIVCITLKPFESLLGKVQKVSALPKFPGISYDVSVICDEALPVEKLMKNFARVDELIVKAEVQSLWRGEGVEDGKKSVTLEFEFRAPDRTLTDKEAKNLEKKLLAELEKRGGKFRF